MAENDKESRAETFPHLPRAPITEALIDFRVKMIPAFDVNAFRDLHTKLAAEFPRFEEQNEVRFEVRHHSEYPPMPQKAARLTGVLFHSPDNTAVAQFRRDGFTFNRLKPYTNWADVFGNASRLWRLYAETVGESNFQVTRIATRYINRMVFPIAEPLVRFLRMQPKLPSEWPHVVPGFVMKVPMIDATGVAANMVLSIEEVSETPYHNTVIFDIDVFQLIQHKMEADELLSRFSKLRAMKNKIFFSGLSEDALNLFK